MAKYYAKVGESGVVVCNKAISVAPTGYVVISSLPPDPGYIYRGGTTWEAPPAPVIPDITNIVVSTTDLTPGVSALPKGTLYLVYDPD